MENRRCDHGHAIFSDGVETEFGWTEPTAEDISEHGSREAYAKHVACQWASDDARKYVPADVVKIWLAG